MSTSIGGIRIVDMPDLGAATAASSLVGERAGSGRFSLPAVRDYVMTAVGAVSIGQFGAVGDGATDNLAAINAAIARLGAAGGIVSFPPGSYLASGPIVVPANVAMRGAGRGATALIMACNANPNITLNTASELSGMQVSGVLPQTGAMVLMQGNAAVIRDFGMAYYYDGIVMLGASSSARVIGAAILDGNMFFPVVGGTGISIHNFGGCFVHGVVMAGPASGPQPAYSVVIKDGDTIVLTNINATLHGPLMVEPTASNFCGGLFISSCLFDSAFGSSAAMFTPSGLVTDTAISNTWFGLSGGHGLVIAPAAGGSVTALDVTGCEFSHNTGGSGIVIDGTGAVGINGINITGGRSEGNSSNGAYVHGPGVSGVTFNGFRAGNYGINGGNGGNGILTADTLDHYVITGCSLYGNTGAGLVDGATGTHKVVANNLVS